MSRLFLLLADSSFFNELLLDFVEQEHHRQNYNTLLFTATFQIYMPINFLNVRYKVVSPAKNCTVH